jgi:vacuolar-type H+-ATPase subunit H
MAWDNDQSLAAHRKSGERSHGARLGSVGQRLTNYFRGVPDYAHEREDGQPTVGFEAEPWPEEHEDVLPRFPIARSGYHCAAVDEHVAELEQELAQIDSELAELRASSVSRDEVSIEIKRIGEQTSAVLIAANEQRDEILRTAREEAERCVADARAKATLLTSEGEARLRALQVQHQAAEHERERLLDEVRNVSAALTALADSPADRPSGPSGCDPAAA